MKPEVQESGGAEGGAGGSWVGGHCWAAAQELGVAETGGKPGAQRDSRLSLRTAPAAPGSRVPGLLGSLSGR